MWRQFLLICVIPLLWTEPLWADSVVSGSDAEKSASAAEKNPELIEQQLLMSYLADNSAFTLIDARSPEEFIQGHVQGAINIPVDQLEELRGELPQQPDAAILVYCKSGKRARRLADTLAAQGYTNVRVLPSQQLVFYDKLVVFNCGAKS